MEVEVRVEGAAQAKVEEAAQAKGAAARDKAGKAVGETVVGEPAAERVGGEGAALAKVVEEALAAALKGAMWAVAEEVMDMRST